MFPSASIYKCVRMGIGSWKHRSDPRSAMMPVASPVTGPVLMAPRRKGSSRHHDANHPISRHPARVQSDTNAAGVELEQESPNRWRYQMTDALPIPSAQYLGISTEHQQYSLEFQSVVIRSYAETHGFVVIKTYTDATPVPKNKSLLRHP
jgi:hypothetical protein